LVGGDRETGSWIPDSILGVESGGDIGYEGELTGDRMRNFVNRSCGYDGPVMGAVRGRKFMISAVIWGDVDEDEEDVLEEADIIST